MRRRNPSSATTVRSAERSARMRRSQSRSASTPVRLRFVGHGGAVCDDSGDWRHVPVHFPTMIVRMTAESGGNGSGCFASETPECTLLSAVEKVMPQ